MSETFQKEMFKKEFDVLLHEIGVLEHRLSKFEQNHREVNEDAFAVLLKAGKDLRKSFADTTTEEIMNDIRGRDFYE